MERTYLGGLYSLERRPLTKSPYGLGRQASWKKLSYRRTICQKHYPGRYLRIDCSDDVAFTQTVIKNSKLSDVLQHIELRYGFLVDANHLLIFDEAQVCLPVVKMMKHVCEQRRDIPVIVTGFLPRLKIRWRPRGPRRKDDLPFLCPVGKINESKLYPLTLSALLFNAN